MTSLIPRHTLLRSGNETDYDLPSHKMTTNTTHITGSSYYFSHVSMTIYQTVFNLKCIHSM